MKPIPRPDCHNRLSVAMIARDEEAVLADSLRSVKNIADEIVVFDNGSTDRTAEIADEMGALVLPESWTMSFAEARNRCLVPVTGDWILWLDAGERLTAESAQQLRKYVDGLEDADSVHLVFVETPPQDPTASCEQIAQIRLVPNRSDLTFQGRVRETLKPSIEAAGLRLEAAPGRITCHPRRSDPARKTLVAQRDLSLASREIAENASTCPRALIARGEAYCELGFHDAARDDFVTALKHTPRASTEMLVAYYGLLSTYDEDKFLGDLQINVCTQALEIFPHDAQLLLAMGKYVQERGRHDLAARSFELAVRYGQVDLEAWHLGQLAEIAVNCLSLSLQTLGRTAEAVQVLEEALRTDESSEKIRRRLIDLHLEQGNCEEALVLVDPLAGGSADELAQLRDAVRGAGLAADKRWAPALAYLQSAYVAGCRDLICLRWLAVAMLSNGQIEAAMPVLLEWRDRAPTDAEVCTYLAIVESGELEPVPSASDDAQWASMPISDEMQRQLRIDRGDSASAPSPSVAPIVSQTVANRNDHSSA